MKEKNENFIIKLFTQSSHYVFGMVLVTLAGFISLPILTRVFSRSDYGIISLVSITVWLGLSFSKAGMQESAVRFYSEFKNGKRKDDISVYYTTLFFSAILFALIVSALLWSLVSFFNINIFGPETKNLLVIAVAMIITGAIILRLFSFYRAAQSTKTYNIISVIKRYFSLALAIFFLFVIQKDITSYYSGIILAQILIIVVLVALLIRKNMLKITNYSWPFFYECLLFGLPLIVNELAGFLLKSTDRYLIQIFLGTESVGVYSLGSDLCMHVKNAIVYPLYYAIVPIYMDMWNNKGMEQTREFLSKVLKYYSLIAIPVMFGFVALAKQIVVIVATSKFEESATIIPYIILGAIFWGYYPIVTAGLYIYKQTKKISLLTLLGVGANIGLNIILIPRMQLQGAALATLITYVVLMLVLMKISFKYLKIQVNFYVLLKIIFASAIMFLALIYLEWGTGIIVLLLNVLIGIVIYGSVMILIEKEMRTVFFNLLHRYFFTKKIFKNSIN
jgi:O-antigen/teichoic acid export membrane protein